VDMEKGDAMTRLLSFAVQLQLSQMVHQLEAGIGKVVTQMDTVSAAQKQAAATLTESQTVSNFVVPLPIDVNLISAILVARTLLWALLVRHASTRIVLRSRTCTSM
jgi:hypothetical protein